ncbi:MULTISPECIES: DEAD/DEAH box helicase [Deefgea]|uniref:DEAD/DEAH box helicase n=1 Tax=Deefgea chitinilytica TaxID=570276 RepID=A0ABS2CDX5_9NEIS|nr:MULTISPECIES: DEAD/DEAH box helicase [Deefgea]MBM5571673.1 DEAD/DEAH box helicase [Deefgea chitinilytica]MBM9888908.1 DEAD/DEAH box helicase [Deefgea sp. CFH1-16]
MSELTFANLGLAEPLLRAISDTGYTAPTPIQAQAIPLVIQGGDLLAAAQTGTGKTAGFTLPILQLLLGKEPLTSKGRPRVLILTPTRELAAQVEESVQTYSKYVQISSMVVFGGVNIRPQQARLRTPLDILVATPGRLLDLVGQRSVDLSGIEILVLDEADRMLDMGFIHDIKKLMAIFPKERQTLLFSATFSDEIKELADKLLQNPGLVEVARRNTTNELISQRVHLVDRDKKLPLLTKLIQDGNWHQVLVFMRTKHACNKVAEKLNAAGITAMAIHGNKSQNARTAALAQFKSGELQVLVATDIAARGLDIEELPHVVNFELPNVAEDYVHRIGRTGRAGCTGEAVSLVCVDELKLLAEIERITKQEIPKFCLEGFEADLRVKPEPIIRGGLGRDRPPRDPNRNSRAPRGQAVAGGARLSGARSKALAETAAAQAAAKSEARAERRARTERTEGESDASRPEGAKEQRRPRNADNRRPRNPEQDREQRRPRQDGAPRNGNPRNGNPRNAARNDSAVAAPRRERINYDEQQPMSNANTLPAELMRSGRSHQSRTYQGNKQYDSYNHGGHRQNDGYGTSRGERSSQRGNRNNRSQTAALLGGGGHKRRDE